MPRKGAALPNTAPRADKQGIVFAPIRRASSALSKAVTNPAQRSAIFASVPAVRPKPIPGASATGRPPIQRYKVVPAAPLHERLLARIGTMTPNNYGLHYDLRVSDDGKMAVKDTKNDTPKGSNRYQDLYLTPEIFNVSQQALKAVGSAVTLTQTATTIRGKPPGNKFKQTLHKITIQYSDTPNNCSYTACNANAWNVMGAARKGKSITTPSHGVFKADVSGSRLIVSHDKDLTAAYKAVRAEITGQATSDQAKKAWEQLGPTEREDAAKKFGINQYVEPEAAEGMSVHKAGTSGQGTMGHFAGILARSGSDYITIENYANNPGGTTVNPNWYVRMFGANQSFYEFHQTHEATEYGAHPIAVRLRGVNPAQIEAEIKRLKEIGEERRAELQKPREEALAYREEETEGVGRKIGSRSPHLWGLAAVAVAYGIGAWAGYLPAPSIMMKKAAGSIPPRLPAPSPHKPAPVISPKMVIMQAPPVYRPVQAGTLESASAPPVYRPQTAASRISQRPPSGR